MTSEEKKRKGKRIPPIVIVITLVICVLIVIFLRSIIIGPGIPPNADLSYLALQEGNPIRGCSLQINQSEMTHDFCIENLQTDNFPQFHELSPTSRYAIVKNAGSDNELVIAIWYFNQKKNFVSEEGQLLKYLKDTGNVSLTELEIPEEPQAIAGKNSSENRYTIPRTLRGIAYSGNVTAGYFFVARQPVSPDREDYFIEYYGLINSTNLSSGTSSIKKLLIANSDSFIFSGNVGPISEDS